MSTNSTKCIFVSGMFSIFYSGILGRLGITKQINPKYLSFSEKKQRNLIQNSLLFKREKNVFIFIKVDLYYAIFSHKLFPASFTYNLIGHANYSRQIRRKISPKIREKHSLSVIRHLKK